jgi:hypothetical protein
MLHRSLRCSFCRRREQDVDKLVAGPRVYICDRCVAIAVELMNAPGGPCPSGARGRAGVLRRIIDRCRRLVGVRQGALTTDEVTAW